mmetsp:Transcript_5174/g.12431  ORF Transcript_5174/g.12431 Transcript_5174/m.12431 type:complete len:244 (+) Transcript_5174:324-1055(+)
MEFNGIAAANLPFIRKHPHAIQNVLWYNLPLLPTLEQLIPVVESRRTLLSQPSIEHVDPTNTPMRFGTESVACEGEPAGSDLISLAASSTGITSGGTSPSSSPSKGSTCMSKGSPGTHSGGTVACTIWPSGACTVSTVPGTASSGTMICKVNGAASFGSSFDNSPGSTSVCSAGLDAVSATGDSASTPALSCSFSLGAAVSNCSCNTLARLASRCLVSAASAALAFSCASNSSCIFLAKSASA